MQTIRANTFETNSSSTHSMVILTEEQEKLFNSGELYFKSDWEDDIITKEERNQIILKSIELTNWEIIPDLSEEENIDMYLSECDDRYGLPISLDQWCESDYLESSSENYTSPSGDKLVIYAKYGYNG
jgi:sucrose-6-phosphate hydrolase SacC (GH32 family)